MTPQVIQFQCNACHATLTVPAHLAGVTGPCPHCGNQITSPTVAAQPVAAPSFAAPPQPAPEQHSLPGQIPSHIHIPTPPAPEQPAPTPWGQVPAVQPIPGVPAMPPLGGTMSGKLGNIPEPAYQPQQPQPFHPQHQQPVQPSLPPQIPPPAGVALPPRRGPSLTAPSSLLGGLGTAPQPGSSYPEHSQPTHNAGIPEPRGQQPGVSSHLIPGAPILGSPAESLPAYGQPPTLGQDPMLGRENLGTPLDPLSSIDAGRQQQPARPRPQYPNRPRRSSSVLMFLVASVLLAGFLGAVGYIFRSPLKDLLAKYLNKGAPEEVSTPAPSSIPAPPAVSSTTPPVVASQSPNPPNPAGAGFDPSEPAKDETVMRATTVPKPEVIEETPSATADTNGSAPKPAPLVEVPTPAVPTPTPDTQPPLPGVSMGSSSAAVVVNVPPEAEDALAALKQFLSARTLLERRPHILGADDPEMVSLVERYYKVNDAGPIMVNNINFIRMDNSPETAKAPHCLFQVATKDLAFPIPVMLQGSPTGFKVDWVSFIEFKDDLLYKFLSNFQENPGSFHVGISRSHYFEEDVPDREAKDCFRIQPPFPTYDGYVFVPKDTPLAQDLRTKISWETQTSYVIVELQWRRLGTFQWVEMTGMPQLNWYSAPDTVANGLAKP